MKSLFLTIGFTFFVTSFYGIECSQTEFLSEKNISETNGQHATEQPSPNQRFIVNRHFRKKYQPIITAFISQNPKKFYHESVSFTIMDDGILASWHITYTAENKLCLYQSYPTDQINELFTPEQCKI